MKIDVTDEDGSKLLEYSGTVIPEVGSCIVLESSDTTLQVLNSAIVINTVSDINFESHANVWVKLI